MQLTKATAWGEAHGLINSVANSVKFDDFKHFEPKWKEEMIKLKKKHSEVIQAKYINKRGKHERLTRPYVKYAGDPVQTWHFIPDQIYDVPRGLVEEVNTQKAWKRSGLLNEDGKPLNKDVEEESVHSFVPVAF